MKTWSAAAILDFTLQCPYATDFQKAPPGLFKDMVCRMQIKRKTAFTSTILRAYITYGRARTITHSSTSSTFYHRLGFKNSAIELLLNINSHTATSFVVPDDVEGVIAVNVIERASLARENLAGWGRKSIFSMLTYRTSFCFWL